MTDTKYNGWTNYETWNAALWIDSYESTSCFWRARAEQIAEAPTYENEFMTRPQRVRHELADELQDCFERAAMDWMRDQASFFADIFNKAVARVEWLEIAKRLLEEVESCDTQN